MTSERWLAAGVPRQITSGGSLRAHHILAELIRRTGAETVERGGGRALAGALVRAPWRIGSRLAAAQLVGPRAWSAVKRLLSPAVLDLHDHPILQLEAMGFPPPPHSRSRTEGMLRDMYASFEWIVAPTGSFAELSAVPNDRCLVIPNGTDMRHIRPAPFPDLPVVALASGAAPGRGIEALADAVELLRSSFPDVELRLALTPAGPTAARGYLDGLRRDTERRPWIRMSEVPYNDIPRFLAAASVVAIPHPPGAYMDVAAPVKLFDAMAAGRPVVTTPRIETARFVGECGAGIVADSDSTEDLAAALAAVLSDREAAQRMGDQGRRCAVERYDWRVLSAQLADAVLGPAES